MFKLDDNFLIELGLGALPPVEKNKMLSHIYETLEMRVGMRLAEKMTNEQLDEFESFINKNDEAGALKWLESNFPNYKQVVAEELDKLKAEITQVAPQIVQSALAAASAPQPPAPFQAVPLQPPTTQQYQQPLQQPPQYAQPAAQQYDPQQQPATVPPITPQYQQPPAQQYVPAQPQQAQYQQPPAAVQQFPSQQQPVSTQQPQYGQGQPAPYPTTPAAAPPTPEPNQQQPYQYPPQQGV